MKTPADFDAWCDEVWMSEHRHVTWAELITAVQEDACGMSQSKTGIGAGDVAPPESTSPADAQAGSSRDVQPQKIGSAISCGDAIATAVAGLSSPQLALPSVESGRADAARPTGRDR
jgi:hypothetical protein